MPDTPGNADPAFAPAAAASAAGLMDRYAGNSFFRWGASAILVLNSLVVLALGLFGSGVGFGGLAFAVLISLVTLIPAVAIAMGWRWGFTWAQYVAGLAVIGGLIALFRVPTMRDDPGKVEAVITIAINSALLALVTLGRPRAVVPASEASARSKPTDPLDWSRDNIEAIVVAFLMALIIRCFCVEVFKIPTGSMEPTLYGDTKPEEPGPPHNGDRIMVDKLGLIFHPVERFGVYVFKFPLDRSRNFIKRIVGLPDEDFRIGHGDIWTRPHKGGDGKFHIARKPPHEQAGIWLPVWPVDAATAETGEHDWTGAPAGSYLDGATFETTGADATFRFAKAVTDAYRSPTLGARVSDVVLRFRATMAAGSEIHVTNARSDGYGRFTAHIAADGTVTFTHLGEDENAFEPAPAPTAASKGAIPPGTDIEVAFFDGAVRVRVGGTEVAAWEYVDVQPGSLSEPLKTPPYPVIFGAKGGAVKFEGVWLGRDIHYNESGRSGESALIGRQEGFLSIPEGKYLAIGDNVNNSKDGRLWRLRTVKMKSGEEWTGDGDSLENFPQKLNESGLQCFRDLDGTDHWFNEDDVQDRGELKRPFRPFVSQEEMVGKALIVWWPLSRFKVIR